MIFFLLISKVKILSRLLKSCDDEFIPNNVNGMWYENILKIIYQKIGSIKTFEIDFWRRS